MNHRETIAYRVAVMQHWLDGGEVERRVKIGSLWFIENNPCFDWHRFEYRKKPRKVKRKGWINVYEGMDSDYMHETKELADRRKGDNRIACVEVEYEFEEPGI